MKQMTFFHEITTVANKFYKHSSQTTDLKPNTIDSESNNANILQFYNDEYILSNIIVEGEYFTYYENLKDKLK